MVKKQNKVPITITVDNDVKQQAMYIIQNQMGSSVSAYINTKFIELVESNKIQE